MLKQGRRRQQLERQTNKKNNFLISRARSMGLVNTAHKILNSETVLSDLIPENLANLPN